MCIRDRGVVVPCEGQRRAGMSTEQNKAVVRRFMTELLAGGNVALIDELCAPNYVNRAMGGIDLAGFKAMFPAMGAVISAMRFNIVDLVAEGDAVVARYTPRSPSPPGRSS